MKNNHIKIIALLTVTVIALLTLAFKTDRVFLVRADDDAVAADYKKNCAACHTPKAEKFFDPAKSVDEHVQVILKGKKGEKPPYMPGFEAKGMTNEQAKALAEHMHKLRTPADANTGNANTSAVMQRR